MGVDIVYRPFYSHQEAEDLNRLVPAVVQVFPAVDDFSAQDP